jgi:hypothetical protein
MVTLGIANSRTKDFYDLYVLASRFAFDGTLLVKAAKATFKRRKTAIPSVKPMALSEEFGSDSAKNIQWNAFVRKNDIEQKAQEFLKMLTTLRDFLLPVMKAAADQDSVPGQWKSGGPWVR